MLTGMVAYCDCLFETTALQVVTNILIANFLVAGFNLSSSNQMLRSIIQDKSVRLGVAGRPLSLTPA